LAYSHEAYRYSEKRSSEYVTCEESTLAEEEKYELSLLHNGVMSPEEEHMA
jgi:hypothetical protein